MLHHAKECRIDTGPLLCVGLAKNLALGHDSLGLDFHLLLELVHLLLLLRPAGHLIHRVWSGLIPFFLLLLDLLRVSLLELRVQSSKLLPVIEVQTVHEEHRLTDLNRHFTFEGGRLLFDN